MLLLEFDCMRLDITNLFIARVYHRRRERIRGTAKANEFTASQRLYARAYKIAASLEHQNCLLLFVFAPIVTIIEMRTVRSCVCTAKHVKFVMLFQLLDV